MPINIEIPTVSDIVSALRGGDNSNFDVKETSTDVPASGESAPSESVQAPVSDKPVQVPAVQLPSMTADSDVQKESATVQEPARSLSAPPADRVQLPTINSIEDVQGLSAEDIDANWEKVRAAVHGGKQSTFRSSYNNNK